MDSYTAPAFTAVDHRVPYRIPVVPETAWSAAPSRRRSWVSRLVLVVVMLIQAALSLRLRNTASTDEASVLVVGRAELAHLLHGAPVQTDLVHHFAGAPRFYPLLAGLGESWDRVAGARLISLACSLAITVVLYSLTRRLFNERVALCAAGAFATLQTSMVLGFYASPDALAVLLVAGAVWVVVRTDRAPLAAVLAAAPLAALAVAAEYASVIVLPSVFVLAMVIGVRYRGVGRSLLRGLLLGAATVGLLLPFASTSRALTGLGDAFGRSGGDASAQSVLWQAVTWGGLFLAVGIAGGISYAWRARMNEMPDIEASAGSRTLRTLLALLLCGTGLLVPAYQVHLHSSTGMMRHLGLGLLFTAPLVGLGISRLVGAHFRHPQLGILLWVLFLALGVQQSWLCFESWPNGSALLSTLYPHVDSRGQYLTEVDGVPAYYLNGRTSAAQWHSARAASTAANVAGVRQGAYAVVVLDSATRGTGARSLAWTVRHSSRYSLLKAIEYVGPDGSTQAYRVYTVR